MDALKATAFSATRIPSDELSGEVEVCEPNGDTWTLFCNITFPGTAHQSIRISGENDSLDYLEKRYGEQAFSLMVAAALKSAPHIITNPMP